MITIVDYGVGNLGSIRNMLQKIGVEAQVATSAHQVDSATKLILPGVGSFDAGMRNLNRTGLTSALSNAVLERSVPVLGICLGMQLMTLDSEEGTLPGLGWIEARTIKFRPAIGETLRVPHMGWSIVEPAKYSAVTRGFSSETRFYFVHSYHVRCAHAQDVLLKARYGSVTFHASFSRANVYGCQFHPEKSHKFGVMLLRNFAESA